MALLLPRACVACGAHLGESEQGLACGTCWSRLPVLPHPRCDRCGHPGVDGECRWCPALPPYVRAARSVCWMPDGVAGALVHAFKYGGWHRLSHELATRMARVPFPPDVSAERQAVVPVPLSSSRKRERGFNQSELLARALGPLWGVEAWCDVLQRTHFTSSQTRLTPAQRLHNVAGAFGIAGEVSRLRGAHVVLVDDVLTTGATLNACAAVLFQGGARLISYVTFGRARLPGDAPP